MKRSVDAGGLSQFFTGPKEQSPVMWLEYTMKEEVNPEILLSALTMALEVFDVFRVTL